MDDKSPTTVGSRRGVRLPPIQTNRNSTVRVKPPLPEELDSDTWANRVPLRPKSHGFTLKKLFTRTRPHPLPASSRNPQTPATAPPDQLRVTSPLSRATPPIASVNATPISVKSSIQFPLPNDDNTLAGEVTGVASSLDPPPLFMVYPQAIKYATLPCPTLSTEEILRRKLRRDLKAGNARDRSTDTDSKSDGSGANGVIKVKNWQKGTRLHARSQSSQPSGMKWSQKIFILLASGHLLQYSVDGNFDRLPEEVLTLGEKSVAFACDAIPGKHWVLQISQTQEDVEPSMEPKKTILDRLRRTNTEPRKPTSSFLLVLDSAEELASWLMFVRREIQGLGGKDYSSEAPGLNQFQPPQTTHQTHGDIRNSMIDQTLSPTLSVRDSQIFVPGHLEDGVKPECQKSIHQSIEVPSPSSLASAPELDSLKRNSRLSCVSIGTRTMPSSQSSSSSVTARTTASKPPGVESPKIPRSPNRVASADLGGRSRPNIGSCANLEDVFSDTPDLPPRAESRIPSTPNFSHPILSKRNSIATSPKTISFPLDGRACQSPISHLIPTFETVDGSKLDELINSNQAPRPGRRKSVGGGIHEPDEADSFAGTDNSQELELDHDVPSSFVRSSNLQRVSQVRRYSSDGIQNANPPLSEYRPALSILEDDPLDIPSQPSRLQSRNSPREVRKRPHSLGPRAYTEPRIRTCRSVRQSSPNPEPSQEPVRRQRSMTTKSCNSRRSSLTSLSSRKSMPHIPHGPPPAPPPTCPLPEVPPGIFPESSPCEASRLSIISCQPLPQKSA
ncbi:peptidase family M20/M25/M40 protein [Microsporum canis CBS 113480]|uniref:Peptidase family M20/M25/M40 protein n=1 Tax=Arthroderma otae (strain ATCC MYA-4605 / CBS 113480) TaxID=554155 RepID=C5FNE9_ARTOC|nr:peptidase family M20/M25/M40 protein [Microsporum canis CBS 113480]EEQ31563.1 peptidase family M20/M25/M40 protein [Microsporum canis CBS 113480]